MCNPVQEWANKVCEGSETSTILRGSMMIGRYLQTRYRDVAGRFFCNTLFILLILCLVGMMNDLYANERSLYQNHFCPSMKLLSKE